MKGKRLAAKIIDLIIFLFLGGLFCGFVYLLIDVLLPNYNLLETFAKFLEDLSKLDIEAAIEYLNNNRETFFVFMTSTFISILLIGVLYFGVIGYFVRGSLGKYVLKIGVNDLKSDKKVSMLKLTLREPFMHLQVISFIFFLVAYFFPGIPMINIFQLLYLILFFSNNDFWNTIFGVKVDAL